MDIHIHINDRLVAAVTRVVTKRRIALAAGLLVIGVGVSQAVLTDPGDFEQGTPISAEAVNARFSALYTAVNENIDAIAADHVATADHAATADAAAAVAGTVQSVSGTTIKLYGLEVTGTDDSPATSHVHLNLTATTNSRVGSAVFEMVGAPHCGYCYSGGPKAIVYTSGNVPMSFYVKGGSVYLQMDKVHGVNIRSSHPIAPEAVTSLPSGAVPVGVLN